MEELKLEDLVFDDGAQIFDAFKQGAKTDNKEVEIKDPSTETKETAKGEDTIKDPESVAKGTEDNKDTESGKTPEAGKEGGNTSSPNDTEKLYSSLATQFKAKGVLPGLDLENTEIKSLEDIEKAITAEVESRLSDKQKAISEAMKVGAPADEVAEQVELISKLKGIPETYVAAEENEAFRKSVIAQDFINKGYDADRAQIMAQRSIDARTDVEDAQFALKAIISHEETSYQGTIDAARKLEEKNIGNVKDYLAKEEEVIGGVKLSATQKDEIYKQMTTDLGGKQNAFMKAQMEDPLGSRVKLETLFYLTKGFKDFSVFTSAKETDISKNIESMLRGTSFTEEGKVQTEIKDPQSAFSLKDLEGLSF